jgi:cytochrome c oxidase subunit I+III
LPLYTDGSESVGWWGMMVLLIADAAVIASFVFTYLFLWTARPVAWPSSGSQMPNFLTPALISATVIGALLLFELADRLNQRGRRGATGVCLLGSAALAVAAVAISWTWLHGLGINPARHSYGA